MQAFLNMIYPNLCLCCSQPIAAGAALCPLCWGGFDFIRGACCQYCGADLPGAEGGGGESCENCLHNPRPWASGRSALMYRGGARDLVLGLKHADRHEIISPSAHWMIDAAAPIWPHMPLLIPVPLHWRRLLMRKYNQSALLARKIGQISGAEVCTDALLRVKYTAPLGEYSKDGRANIMQNAISANPARSEQIQGRNVVLIDDVITTGATLGACTRACQAAAAKSVCIMTLACVEKGW